MSMHGPAQGINGDDGGQQHCRYRHRRAGEDSAPETPTIPYKQATSLSYLCGFAEPESVLVLLPGREQGECLLFCREKDKLRETLGRFIVRAQRGCRRLIIAVDDAFPDWRH